MDKIVIAAGTGLLGTILIDYYRTKATEIIVLTRQQKTSFGNVRYIQWDARSIGTWIESINQATVLINLTGKSVDCRYTPKNKQQILASRIRATQVLGKAIQQLEHPPKIWINASTATIYKHSLAKGMDETHGAIGTGFSVRVATKWEDSFFSFKTPNTRKIALRTAIVLSTKGGALPPILQLINYGFGGKQGRGNQKFSWIHEIDFARSVDFIINTTHLEGPINVAAPTVTTNTELMRTLRKVLKIPFGIPLPTLLLAIGSRMINTETELILKSRYILPKKLIAHQFHFLHPELESALQNLCLQKQ